MALCISEELDIAVEVVVQHSLDIDLMKAIIWKKRGLDSVRKRN